MSNTNLVTIEKIEVKKSDLAKVKRLFKIKDNAEAVKKALDLASGKIELENIFEKYKGTKIEKVKQWGQTYNIHLRGIVLKCIL